MTVVERSQAQPPEAIVGAAAADHPGATSLTERNLAAPPSHAILGDDSGRYSLYAPPLNDESPAICGAFLRAAEGTRTLDLLHGKQTL